MASTSARLFFKNCRLAAQSIGCRSSNLADSAQNVKMIRSLLFVSEQKSIAQIPVFSDSFPVIQNGFLGSMIAEEKGIRLPAADGHVVVEAARGKREDSEEEHSEDEDFDDEDMDDFDEDDSDMEDGSDFETSSGSEEDEDHVRNPK